MTSSPGKLNANDIPLGCAACPCQNLLRTHLRQHAKSAQRSSSKTMHNFASIFKDANIRSSLPQLTEAHLDRIEASLFDKKRRRLLT